MKKLIGVVVILVALVLVGYYGMGMVAERTVKHHIAAINKTNGLAIEVTQYKRGWFTSQALLNAVIHIPENVVKVDDNQTQVIPAQDYDFQIPLNIYHGPIIFAHHTIKFGLGYATTDLKLPPKYSEKFNEKFTAQSTQPILNLSLFISYLNDSHVEMSLPSFKLIAKQGDQQFDWNGSTSSTLVTTHAKKIKGKVTVKGFQISKDQTTAAIGTIAADYRMHKTESKMYLGDVNMSLSSLVVATKERKIFELNNFELHSSSDIKDGLFNSEFKLSVAKIFADNQAYGPGKLDVAIRNLDANTLARIHQQANLAQQGTDIERKQALFAIIPEVPKLFSRGAEFDINELSMVMPQGTAVGNLTISLSKGETSNPFELIQKIQGKGRLSIPSEVLKFILDELNKQKLASQNAATQPQQALTTPTTEQINNMSNAQIAAMLQSGLLIQQEGAYVIDLILAKGQLQVNGKPFNPAMTKF